MIWRVFNTLFSHSFLLKFIAAEEEIKVYQIQTISTAEKLRFVLKATVLAILTLGKRMTQTLVFQI